MFVREGVPQSGGARGKGAVLFGFALQGGRTRGDLLGKAGPRLDCEGPGALAAKPDSHKVLPSPRSRREHDHHPRQHLSSASYRQWWAGDGSAAAALMDGRSGPSGAQGVLRPPGLVMEDEDCPSVAVGLRGRSRACTAAGRRNFTMCRVRNASAGLEHRAGRLFLAPDLPKLHPSGLPAGLDSLSKRQHARASSGLERRRPSALCEAAGGGRAGGHRARRTPKSSRPRCAAAVSGPMVARRSASPPSRATMGGARRASSWAILCCLCCGARVRRFVS